MHNPTSRSGETKPFLNEANVIVGFLNGMGNRAIDYVMNQYLGLSVKQIKKLRKLNDDSRWVAIFKGSPQVICTQYLAYANYASNDDDD